MTWRLFLLALAFVATPVSAKRDISADFRQIVAGEAVTLRPDRAYVLLRIDTSLSKFTANILRKPSEAEMAEYAKAKLAAHAKAGKKGGAIDAFAFEYEGRPNFFELNSKKPLVVLGKTATVLAEMTPGDYIFYGEGFPGFLYQCFCLGTVGFPLPAGEVTDLGTMIIAKAWEPSPVPELAAEVDIGPTAVMDYGLFAVALRPVRPSDSVPAGIDQARIKAAQLQAVGPFVEPNTLQINRLAAIPGVLTYDGGRVIDARTGAEVPQN